MRRSRKFLVFRDLLSSYSKLSIGACRARARLHHSLFLRSGNFDFPSLTMTKNNNEMLCQRPGFIEDSSPFAKFGYDR